VGKIRARFDEEPAQMGSPSLMFPPDMMFEWRAGRILRRLMPTADALWHTSLLLVGVFLLAAFVLAATERED